MTVIVYSVTWASMMIWVLPQAPPPTNETLPSSALLDSTPAPGQEEGNRTKVVALKYASCRDVLRAVGAIVRPLNAVCDERTNCVILYGSDKPIERAMQIIESLDRPVGERPLSGSLAIIALKHRSALEISQHVNQLMAARRDASSVRVTADPVSNAVLIDAPQLFIERARELIQSLDTPQQSVRLEFAMLHSSMIDSKSADNDPLTAVTSPLPADLADVAGELTRFGKLRLLGRLGTTASESQKFNIEGSVGQAISLEVDGRLLDCSAGIARLEIEASIAYRGGAAGSAASQPARSSSPMFRLHTSVTALRGDTVVIGTAPAGWKPGESAILVVRIGRTETATGKHDRMIR